MFGVTDADLSFWIMASLLGLGCLVFYIAMHIASRRAESRWQRAEQEIREQQAKSLDELTKAVAVWLDQLELPALAEESRRIEVSRQLGIVLIEKLMRRRLCVPHPTAHSLEP